jgi:hypothetical protein
MVNQKIKRHAPRVICPAPFKRKGKYRHIPKKKNDDTVLDLLLRHVNVSTMWRVDRFLIVDNSYYMLNEFIAINQQSCHWCAKLITPCCCWICECSIIDLFWKGEEFTWMEFARRLWAKWWWHVTLLQDQKRKVVVKWEQKSASY